MIEIGGGVSELFIGVGRLELLFRHVEHTKDKRRILQGLVQKLKNRGFSVVDCGDPDQKKIGILGFTLAGKGDAAVQAELDAIDSLLIGEFHVVCFDKEVIAYTELDTAKALLEEEEMPWEKS